MFDFEKLDVYQVIKKQNLEVLNFIFSNTALDPYIKDQWKRASLSSLFNLAEGVGRMDVNDKKHFITIARGSVYESVAILDVVKGLEMISDEKCKELYDNYETISKMLLGMYRSYN
jgi:four helix bundle protein